MQQLKDPTTAPPVEANLQYSEFSTDSGYVVTATELGCTIMITNLHSISSKFIDTEFKICGLTLTGNILLVQGVGVLVAWRLTAEGTVDGTPGISRVGCGDSCWTKPLQDHTVQFWVDKHIGVIKCAGDFTYYNTETGEELESVSGNEPHFSFYWQDLTPNSEHLGFETWSSFNCEDFVKRDNSLEDSPSDNDPSENNPSEDDLPSECHP